MTAMSLLLLSVAGGELLIQGTKLCACKVLRKRGQFRGLCRAIWPAGSQEETARCC